MASQFERVYVDAFIDLYFSRFRLLSSNCVAENVAEIPEEVKKRIYDASCDAGFCMPVTPSMVDARAFTVRGYQARLAELLRAPGIAQRTTEWYEARKTLITASDVAQALGEGKFGNQRQLIAKKCGYEVEKPFNAMIPPLKWGVMYEPVAQGLYSTRNSTSIHEFGLLRHRTVEHLGASPDGITPYGVMLEIKCPYRRKIDGTVPRQYYYQIQAQLEVCGLHECDYLECELSEYRDWEGFLADAASEDAWFRTQEQMPKGVVAEFRSELLDPSSGDAQPRYSYVFADRVSPNELAEWLAAQRAVADFYCFHYWHLVKYSCIRVYRDDEFVSTMLAKLGEVWQKIESYKGDRDAYVKDVCKGVDPNNVVAPIPKCPPKSVQAQGYAFIDEDA